MKAPKLKPIEDQISDADSEVIAEEKALILLESRPKKKVDETISTPDKYVSRYHYDTQDLAKILELCPHCRQPSITAFRRVVVDNAIDYLAEKEEWRDHRAQRRRIMSLIAGLVSIVAGLYYLLFHVISGFRI